MRLGSVIFSVGLFSFSATLQAQNNPYNEVSIASPTAASLGKYADIPVNFHTGIPQISIPIYTVKEGPLQLPISLSYHAGGLKVMELASWVGAGWSLNAGGVITRTVQGAPDERGTSNVYDQTHGHFSDYGYNSALWIPYQGGTGYMQDWAKIADGRKDGEPDIFFFSFNGYTGKFYFRDDRTPMLVPEQDIKISYTYTGVGSIQSFILTTPDGVKYHFGATINASDVDPIEKTDPYTGDGAFAAGWVISSWYLDKIVSADEKFSISLSYVAENYSYSTLSMFPVSWQNQTDADPTNDSEYKLLKNFINGVRLSRITFSNGQVDFVASTNPREDLTAGLPFAVTTDYANTEAKSLAAIEISNGGANCKKYTFLYSYFTDNLSPLTGNLSTLSVYTDKKRLKLESIQEQSCDGSTNVPPHTFEYFTELVPRRLSFGQDHWGFYNGVSNNSQLIPTYTLTNEFRDIAGANRDAAWPAMRGGALKKITYPTGGYSEFDFEPNYSWVSYSKSQWVYRFGQTAGYDGSSNPVTTYQTFSGGTYKMWFINSSVGSQALLSIYNSSDVEVSGWVLEPGQCTQPTLQYAAGTYSIVLRKLSAVSGNGTSVSFDEWTSTPIQKNEVVGGLRIKTLTHHDAVTAQNNIVTSYTYEANGKSTGILCSRPVYVSKLRNDILRDVGYQTGPHCNLYGCTSCNGSADYFKSPSSIRPMETTQGNHIGYNEVKVAQTGNGHSVYRYYGSNVWDVNTSDVALRSINATDCNPGLPNSPDAPLPHEFMRGELKYEGHFTESGQLLKEIEYYPVYAENPLPIPGLIVNRSAIVVNPNYGQPFSGGTTAGAPNLATFYELKTARKTQMQIVEKMLTPGAGMMTTSITTYFESPYHNQPTRQTKTTSGETLETRFKYASDFRIASCDAISSCYPEYTTAINTCLSQYNAAIAACSDHECRWWAWQTYMKCKSDARISYNNCRKSNFTNASNNFDNCKQGALSAAYAWLKPVLELQAQFSNFPIEETSWRGAKLIGAKFYKYDYSTSPATKVYLNKILAIPLASPSATFTAATNSATTITKDSRYQEESSYKFFDGNLVEVIAKNGIPTSYIWGHNNTLPIVKTVGVNHATLKTAYDATGGILSQLRSHSSLVTAHVNTYTYNPLVGMLSETNQNSRTQSYEYDPLYRLLRIRDHNNNIVKQFEYKYQYAPCGANWQNEGTQYCEQVSAQNTGYLLQQQRDLNPCSQTYNQLRVINVGYNTSSCPLPPTCNTSNCTGPDKKCINNVCQTGVKVYTASTQIGPHLWECTYHYTWSDGSWSQNYTEQSPTMCEM